ncbi:MAG: SsgA family sporulation/cell division regulator [Mycobacteriales bacterium]
MASTDTTRGLGGALRLPGLPELPVTVLARCAGAETRLVVLLDADDSVELVLARELLTAGLGAPVADGQVQVAPSGGEVRVTAAGLDLVLAAADVAALVGGCGRVIALDDRAGALSGA